MNLAGNALFNLECYSRERPQVKRLRGVEFLNPGCCGAWSPTRTRRGQKPFVACPHGVC